MHRFWKGLLVLSVFSALAIAGSQSPKAANPVVLLQKMAYFLNSSSYTAIILNRKMQGPLEAVKVLHQYSPQHRWEKILFLDGTGRQLIQNDNTLFADGFKIQNAHWHPRIEYFEDGIPTDTRLLKQYYYLKVVGHESVSEHPATIVELTPKQSQLYHWKLWIGDQPAMLLKTLMLSRQGQELEQHTLIPLSIAPIPQSEFIAPKHAIAHSVRWSHTITSQTYNRIINTHSTVGWMPKHFAQLGAHYFLESVSKNPVEHLIYSNGTDKISIFIEKSGERIPQGNLPIAIKKQIKTTVGISSIVQRNQQFFMITVVGNIPIATAETILSSVKPAL